MESYYSKVLLFGEHSVVNGGKAIAAPLSHFSGSWVFRKDKLDRGLVSFGDYIDHHDSLFKLINVDSFFQDLDRGLHFDSSIPIGSGLGSSGALVAAIYKQYAKSLDSFSSLSEIQQIFADLESHFHGKSSGFDPMVSYYNRPLLVGPKSIRKLDGLSLDYGTNGVLFLMNTHVHRSTGPLVQLYQEHISQPDHLTSIQKEYVPLVDQAIKALIKHDFEKLYSAFESISGYQYAYLDFLIDEGSKRIWKEGLASDYFKVKICGAGGGGYLLGVTSDLDRMIQSYPEREIIKL